MADHHMADLTQSPAPPDIRPIPGGPKPLIISLIVRVDYRAWPKDAPVRMKSARA